MSTRLSFYRDIVDAWLPQRDESILVVAGGPNDRDVFRDLDFTNVTITNLSDASEEALPPFTFARQDLEQLTYPDGHFDHVIVHAGLHHCHSPHRGLSEMYRVSSRSVVVIEPPDNLVMRALMRLGLAQEYEVQAVVANGGTSGGVADTHVPNYVYRWSRREVVKVLSALDPTTRPTVSFAYGVDLPSRGFMARSRGRQLAAKIGFPFFNLLVAAVPSLGNLLAFAATKPTNPTDLHPWLKRQGDELRFVGHVS